MTLRQLNDVFSTAMPAPFSVNYATGGSITLQNPLPPLFPDSDIAVSFPFSKNSITGTWSVDTAATDSSFSAAIATSGPSATTQGALVTFALPVILGAARVLEPVTVGAVLDSPEGKFAENFAAVAILESSDMFIPIKRTMKSALNNTFDIVSSVGSADLSLFVNNTDLKVGSGDLLRVPKLPVTVPPTTMRLSVKQLMSLAGVSEEFVSTQIGVAMSQIDKFSTSGVVPTTAVQMTGRQTTYLKDSLELTRAFLEFTNTISQRIGVMYPARFLLPLLEVMLATLNIRYFLDSVFNAVIALIVFLSTLLVFSLLLNDVETKTYEYGMLRALGMRKSNLLQILFTKSLLFSIFGVGIGLFVAFLVSIPVTDMITGISDVSAHYSVSGTAAIVATVVGVVMPLIASTVPIMRALSKTLRDSLDVYHHVVSDVTVSLVRLADMGFSPWQTAIALLLVSVGFLAFYLVPLSFLNDNMPMFLGLMMAILLTMLLGCVILAQLVQPFLERGILWVIMRPFHGNLNALVAKSLSAHRPRNAKTAQMFTIALAFIIFAGVVLVLIGNAFADNMKIAFGAPIVITAPNVAQALDEGVMTPFLETQVALTKAGADDGILMACSFVTFQLNELSNVYWTRLSNLAGVPRQRQDIYGIQKSFYSSIYSEHYDDAERSTGGDPAIVGIFTQAGEAKLPIERLGAPMPTSFSTGLSDLSVTDVHTTRLARAKTQRNTAIKSTYGAYIDAVCSEGLRTSSSIGIETAAKINVASVYLSSGLYKNEHNYVSKIRGMARHVPGFEFSSYALMSGARTLLIREDQYLRILNDAVGSDGTPFSTAPKMRLMLNVKSSATSSQREDLVAGLRAFFASDDVTVTDTQNLIDATGFALDLISLFFVIVSVIAMLLCFLILWLSFTANVEENAWEFGVLRAVGLSAKQVVMVYVYEALSIVLACIFLGTTIGIAIAVSLTMQFNMLTEVKFKMEFPFLLYFLQFGLAILVAVLASALPTIGFVRRTVADILRRT